MTNLGDYPIKSGDDDRLERQAGSHALATEIREIDASDGFVLAVVGPWGSGKTSILNMVRESLANEPALMQIDFNPWVFSGTNELVGAFFRELSAQMKLKDRKFEELAGHINNYGDLLSPIGLLPGLGPWFTRVRGAVKAIDEYQKRRNEGLSVQRDRVSRGLRALDAPIVVVVDDIDRLESQEIRDLFKLVRLTANFPNVVYLLAFDRRRVEEALGQSGFDGRAYLEKIIQLGVSVPAVPDSVMLRQITTALDEAISDIPDHRFNEDAWPDVLAEVIRPLIKNMRDVKRYATAVRSKARTLAGQVELVDVLGLEAVRLFLPDAFDAISAGRLGLTTPATSWGGGPEDPRLPQQVQAVVQSASEHAGVLRSLVERLFPAGARHLGNMEYGSDWKKEWLKGRRVAHPDVLAWYLEQVANEGMKAFALAEEAFAVLADEEALRELIAGYDLETLEDVISSLEVFERVFPVESVVPASRVLLNLLPSLPERPRGMLSFGGPRLVVTRVVLRLLRRIETPEQVRLAVDQILASVTSFSSRLELLMLVGYREGSGHKLVTESDADELERDFRAELGMAASADLATERALMRLLYAPKLAGQPVLEVRPDQVDLARAVILDARSEVRSQTMGSRAVRRSLRLHWDVLTELFGGEGNLRAAIESLRDDADPEVIEVVALAERYLDGWRPSEWGDDD